MRDGRIPIWVWLIVSVLALLLRLNEGWRQEKDLWIFDWVTVTALASTVIAAFVLWSPKRRRSRYEKNGSPSEPHVLMRQLAAVLGRPASDLQTHEDQRTLRITLPDKSTGLPLAELSRLATTAVGPKPWQAGYSMDRVAIVPNLASKIESLLTAAGYSYQSRGYKGLAIYSRDPDIDRNAPQSASKSATWLGQPINTTADIANAVFSTAMISVQGAEQKLREVAKSCRKDLNAMQMESLYLTLFSSRLALSRETYDDEFLEADVLSEFDALVTTYCAKKDGFRGALARRSDEYLLALVPGSEIATTIGKEYARASGCEDKLVASVGAALASTIMKSAEDLVSTYRQSRQE
ncbi:MAG: hypothetical protein ABR585_12045 [Gemmatimonadaceae bacterium]